MFKIVHRYILVEIFGPFVLALGVFLFVLLMGRLLKIVEMIVRQGVNPLDILRMLTFLIPSFLPMAIPMAVLLAGVVGFSRLSSDLEITALKASGVSLYQLLPPVAVFAVGTFLLTLALTLYGAPQGAFAFRQMAIQLAKKNLSVVLKEGVFNELFKDFVIYAEKIRLGEGRMEGVFIHDQRSTDVPIQIIARSGAIEREKSGREIFSIKLENGSVFQLNRNEGKMRRIHFDQYEVNLDLSSTKIGRKLMIRREEERSLGALIRTIQRRHARGKRVEEYLTEVHRRFAIPTTCLLFGFLALPLALQSRPQGRSHGFLMGTLILLVYYMIFSMGRTLADTYRFPGWIGLWGPNVLLASFTIFLFIRTANERPSGILMGANALIDLLQSWSERIWGGKS